MPLLDEGSVANMPVSAFKSFFDVGASSVELRPRWSGAASVGQQQRAANDNSGDSSWDGSSFNTLLEEAENTLEGEKKDFPREYFNLKTSSAS